MPANELLANVDRLLDQTDLPPAIRERVRCLIAASSLRPTECVDVARELIAHFEDGLAAGADPDRLLQEFGNDRVAAALIRSAKRSARGASRSGGLAGKLAADVDHAFRRLWKSPGFAAVAIVSLAIGIGANTAVFSVVNGLLIRKVAAARPDELLEIYQSQTGFPYNVFSYPDYEDFRDGTRSVFSDVAGSTYAIAVRDTSDGVETTFAEAVTGNYFPMLEISPTVGRLLGHEDDVADGAHPVVVLNYPFWLQAFAADPAVVGREIVLSGIPYTIVGVAPESYTGMVRGLNPDMFVPIRMADALEGTTTKLSTRNNHSIFVRGRLQAGATLSQAEQAAEAVAVRLRADVPESWDPTDGFRLRMTNDVVMFPMFDGPIALGAWLLLGVVALVLMIACANLASFLLTRAVDRRKEVAVRLALGAERSDLIRGFMVETMCLAVLGGLAGVGVAAWSVRFMSTLDLPFPVPLTFDFSLDTTVLGFSLLVSLAAGALFGFAPALQASKPDLVTTLRDETAGGGQGGRSRLRNVLVVAQVATSVVLLVSAGLFLRSLQAVYAFDPGFGTKPAAVITFAIPRTSYEPDQIRTMVDDLQREFEGRADVESVGHISNVHLSQTNTTTAEVVVDGVPGPDGQDGHVVDFAAADAEFFAAAQIDLQEGRLFNAGDDQESGRVGIVSEAFAERFWPGESALGRVVRTRDGEWLIVGVAADTKVRTLGEAPRPFLYGAMDQENRSYMSAVIAVRSAPQRVASDYMFALRDRAPDALVYNAHTMDDHLETVRFPARITAVMFSFFAAIALVLATIGLYGLVSYTQAQRTHEVGIRMSLGADARSVVSLLVRGGMKLVWLGVAIGAAVAFGLTRVLAGLLFGVGATDLATFAAVVVGLSTVALVAAWIPARRASRIDPVQALRAE